MKRERGLLAVLILAAMIIGGGGIYLSGLELQSKSTLTISTTTSLYDTGLLDELKNQYEAEHPSVRVAFIPAGTGIAIEHAKNGDADMILVHSPSQEYSFMNETYGVNRKVFAYNFFTIIGPADDPAATLQTDALTALQMIYFYGHAHNTTLWVSRDDNSGTNSKEKSLWSAAGFDYDVIKEEPWFISSGSGMGSTLNIAENQNLYTLADIGTYLAYKSQGLIKLEQFVDEDEMLINIYSAIAVNQTTVPATNFDMAMAFIQWLLSDPIQTFIHDFGQSEYGLSLFQSAVPVLDAQSPLEIYTWIRNHGFFDYGGTLYECPPIWREGNYGLYP
ncbi:MAG: substrate-binding domain-containing protein [Candidatus Thorarchaeota archaeon]